MGILTHLDQISKAKPLKKIKKTLKARFWVEVYQGAKLFYFSGEILISSFLSSCSSSWLYSSDQSHCFSASSGLINGSYPHVEIHNLCLYISRMKFRPMPWRLTHPYILVDRVEVRPTLDRFACSSSAPHQLLTAFVFLNLNLTHACCDISYVQDVTNPAVVEQDPLADRSVALYGFVRGAFLKSGVPVSGRAVHILHAFCSIVFPCFVEDGVVSRCCLDVCKADLLLLIYSSVAFGTLHTFCARTTVKLMCSMWLQVHLAGVGDFIVDDVSPCPDPVPLPETDPEKKKARRTLNAKVCVCACVCV